MHVQPTLDALKTRGYNTLCIDLASVQTSKPRPTWEQEVTNISNGVLNHLKETSQDVCLVLHSYANLPGCEAVNRIVQAGGLEATPERKGRLRKVIFFYGHHTPTGLIMDVKNFVGPANPAFSIDEETDMQYHKQPYELFFSDIPTEEEAQPYVDEIKPMWYIPGGGGIMSDDWMRVPRSIVASSKDKALPPEVLGQMWNDVAEEIVWTTTAHTPFMTAPDYIADLWVDLLNKPAPAV